MASRYFKTLHGEVYGKCGLMFGNDPVAVPADKLAEKLGSLGQTIGERLEQDPRLVEVAAPETPVAATEDGSDGGKSRKPGRGER